MAEAKPCRATMVSVLVPGHIHECTGQHDGGDHFCSECRRWFYSKGETER